MVFIGLVDILGYKSLENILKRFDPETSQALKDKIFNQLDQFTDMLKASSDITWERYGDSYVIYSPDDNTQWLSEMVKKSCKLIAFSLKASIPLFEKRASHSVYWKESKCKEKFDAINK